MTNTPRFERSTEDRFWSKVQKTDGCWTWTASKDSCGYGTFRLSGKIRKAHRVSYELSHGPIPDGMHVCHRCDVPACVNPSHLFLGTHADNMADMAAKGRATPPKGAEHHSAKLTEVQVVYIRWLFASGLMKQRQLAESFGVSRGLIGHISQRRKWGEAA